MDLTNDQIIDKIIEREGGYVNDPSDAGGRTQFGVSEKSNPQAWVDGKVTHGEAREIFYKKYLLSTGLHQVEPPQLRYQLVDFAINSGPYPAIFALQRVVKVTQDGKIGPETLKALNQADSRTINNLVVAERVKLIGRILNRTPTQSKFALGWLTRAVDFLI